MGPDEDPDLEARGWLVVASGALWCRRCAADVAEARALAGVQADDEMVRVAPVPAEMAAGMGWRCDRCGRPLTET